MAFDKIRAIQWGISRGMPMIMANFAPLTLLAVISFGYHCLLVLGGSIMPMHCHLMALAAGFYLLSRFSYAMAVTFFGAHNFYLPKDTMGKWMGTVRNARGGLPEKLGGEGLVCFIVGSSQNHPLGVFAPQVKYVGKYFNKMWMELEANREKWGFLGRTDLLISQAPGRGNNLLYVSYWRTIEDLHRFNLSPFHMEIRRWWDEHLSEMPHLGIFHETFAIPAHKWETIYENFHPMGLGQTQVMSDVEKVDAYTSALLPATGTTMHSRMSKIRSAGS